MGTLEYFNEVNNVSTLIPEICSFLNNSLLIKGNSRDTETEREDSAMISEKLAERARKRLRELKREAGRKGGLIRQQKLREVKAQAALIPADKSARSQPEVLGDEPREDFVASQTSVGPEPESLPRGELQKLAEPLALRLGAITEKDIHRAARTLRRKLKSGDDNAAIQAAKTILSLANAFPSKSSPLRQKLEVEVRMKPFAQARAIDVHSWRRER